MKLLLGFGCIALFGGLFALVVVLAVAGAAKARRQLAELVRFAASEGWHQVPAAGPLPPVLAKAARSRRSRLLLGTRAHGQELWVNWHRWTESQSTGGEHGSTVTTTHDLTSYYLPAPGLPHIAVVRRSGLGGLFVPRRGVGTGDAAFDRAFLIKPADNAQLPRLLTPRLRQLMLGGAVGPWTVTGGLLVTSYPDALTGANLRPRADALLHLAALLRGTDR